jgi:hypothetical protein
MPPDENSIYTAFLLRSELVVGFVVKDRRTGYEDPTGETPLGFPLSVKLRLT